MRHEKTMPRGFFRQALFSWPENNATRQSGLRLAEMTGAGSLIEEAKGLMASGNYLEAHNIFWALAMSPEKQIRDESVLNLAYCSLHMDRCEEASNHFLQWFSENSDAPDADRVEADLGNARPSSPRTRNGWAGSNRKQQHLPDMG